METKAYLFDLDGTLTENFSDVLRPEAVAWFSEHAPERVAICSNQGGVGLRYEMELGEWGEPGKFPNEAQVTQRLETVVAEIEQLIGNEVRWYVAYAYYFARGARWSRTPPGYENVPAWSQDWRKPQPGMLLQAAADLGVKPQECIYIGNGVEDAMAANFARMKFANEERFIRRIGDDIPF